MQKRAMSFQDFAKENALALNIGIAIAASVTCVAIGFIVRSKHQDRLEGEIQDSSNEETDEESKYPGGKMSIYFGSQTGTAEGFAKDLAAEGKNFGFNTKVIDLEDFEADQVTESKLSIFIMATYGYGEPTDNATEFVNFLKQDAAFSPSNAYAVFGLGNRQYEQFNQTSKTVDKVLEKRGAARVFELGLGDDDGTLEARQTPPPFPPRCFEEGEKSCAAPEDWEAWRERLWPVLKAKYVGDAALPAAAPAGPAPPPFELRLLPPGETAPPRRLMDAETAPATRHYFAARPLPVLVNRELRSGGGGSTLHLELGLAGAKLSYRTADNLAVLPQNDPAQVEALGRAQGWDLDRYLELKMHRGHKAPFPSPCATRWALLAYADFNAPPRKAHLLHLAAHASDRREVERLVRLAGKQGAEEYKRVFEREGHSLFEALTELFPSVRLPLDQFLALAPHLQPRYYTVSSSSSAHPSRVHLTVAVVADKHHHRRDGRAFKGVCTHYLRGLRPGEEGEEAAAPAHSGAFPFGLGGRFGGGQKAAAGPYVRAFVRPSTFALPKDPATPIVLIGPGTGIAPMRALLQEAGAPGRRGPGRRPQPALLWLQAPEPRLHLQGRAGGLGGLGGHFEAAAGVQPGLQEEGLRAAPAG
ncbi:unnamed protein product [Heterosigma akashiwo]